MSNQLSSLLNVCHRFAQEHLPQTCLLCGTRVNGELLCHACAADLPRLPDARCPQCALPSLGGNVCGACLRHPPAFERTVAVYAYAFPLDALVRHCKYDGALGVTDWFANRLFETLDVDVLPELILPMPLHEARLAQRGFNQAVEIARRLAPRLGIPWSPEACRRIRDTPPQAGLDLKARRRNLRDAFRCNLDLTGKHVALVDDVMTSGTSLDELGKVIRASGAVAVSAWVVARTL